MTLLYRHFFAALAATFTSAALMAQAPVRQMEGVTEYQLSNGLQVLLAPNDLQTRTYVNLVVKAGSAVEGSGEGGMAHLLEHLVFKGTPTTKDPMREFTERSLNYNGTTNRDRTNYFAAMNPNAAHLNWYLAWLADAMSNSLITKADLDSEMTVVRNEFERAGSNAGGSVYEARMALAFPNHGYGRPTIGNLSDIENVPITRLQAFYKTWYRPDNMVLVVTGRFDSAAALAHIQTVFGAIPKPSAALPKLYSREPAQQGLRGATINRAGGEPITLIGWRGAPALHRDDAVLDVLAHALANSAIGRFTTAVNEQNLGTNVNASHASMKDYGLFNVSLQAADASKINLAQTLLLKQIADLAKSGVNAEELNRAKKYYETRSETVKNSAESVGNMLAESAAVGDWRQSFWHRDQMAGVTIEDTQRAAAQYLVEANRVRVSYIPQANPVRAPEALPTALTDYTAAPSARALARGGASTALERFEATAEQLDARTVQATLPVGTRMAMIARPAVGDAIQGTLRLHWGTVDSLKNRWAVSLLGSLLLRGTANRSQKQLEDELNALQSTLSIQSGVNGLTLSFKTTRQDWPAFSNLLHDVLRQPDFKATPFNTWKKQITATWQAGRDAPDTLATTAVNRALYNYDRADPRYSPSNDEAIEALNAVSIEDIKAFWTSFAGASVSEFAAVGALDAAQMQADMAKVLGGWDTPGGGAAYQRIAYPLAPYSPARRLITTADKPNAGYRATQVFRAVPFSREGFALQLASELIGGSSSSRLYTRLRKEEGLTYGTYSSISASEDDSVATFTIQGSYAPQNLGKFEAVLADTLQEIQARGFETSELDRAKRSFAERVQTARNNDAAVANALANNAFRSTPTEPRNFARADRMNALALSVTLEDLHAAAKQLVDLRKAVIVITGDFK